MSRTPLEVQDAPRTSAGPRLVSLDAYRGFIMFLLISHGFGFSVLQHYSGWEWLARQTDHVEWTGVQFWDLIQPAFTFMVGLAMPFAFARRRCDGATTFDLFRHVVWRSIALILLSNVLSNFNTRGPRPVLQLINVLCQIAFGYFICFLILQLRFRWQVAIAALMLAAHWGLFLAFPGPDGPFTKTGNIGQVIDLAVFGYTYQDGYTTINFIGNAVTILFGCWAGLLMQSKRSHAEKMKFLSLCAATGFAAGLALEPLNPMVKKLWTASFTLFSTGWVIVMLMAFYWLIEMRGTRRWAFPFVVLGMNSIFVYSFTQVLRGWLDHGLGVFTGRFWWVGQLGVIPQNLCVLAALWYMCYQLFRRKIFVRI